MAIPWGDGPDVHLILPVLRISRMAGSVNDCAAPDSPPLFGQRCAYRGIGARRWTARVHTAGRARPGRPASGAADRAAVGIDGAADLHVDQPLDNHGQRLVRMHLWVGAVCEPAPPPRVPRIRLAWYPAPRRLLLLAPCRIRLDVAHQQPPRLLQLVHGVPGC